ncbi:MAG TPA: hypothetical protein VFH49_07945, partial [Aquabacterium sp.]|nr:hypothetical protein [Aquabacterium sp.]
GGDLSVTATTGNIVDSGTVTVGGNLSLSTSATDATITANQLAVTGEIDVHTTGSAAAASLVNATGITLGASSVGGALNVTATTGNISDNGTVSVGGNLQLSTSANNATINANELNVAGTIGLSTTGSAAHATVVNALGLNLAASTVGGNLSATASGGNLEDSGTVTVGGNASYAATQTGSYIYLLNQNISGTVGFSTVNGFAYILNAQAVTLSASTVNGDLVVRSPGNIDQVSGNGGNLTITGATYLDVQTPGSDILLASATNNSFGGFIEFNGWGNAANVRDLALLNTSATASFPSLTGLRNLTLNFSGVALDLPALTISGNLDITAGGAITQSGIIAVAGTSSFSAAGQTITLSNASNNFTDLVTVTGAGVSITDVNDLSVTLNTTGATTLTAGGNLTVSGSSA